MFELQPAELMLHPITNAQQNPDSGANIYLASCSVSLRFCCAVVSLWDSLPIASSSLPAIRSLMPISHYFQDGFEWLECIDEFQKRFVVRIGRRSPATIQAISVVLSP